MTAGVRSTPGVLIVPLKKEFHWSRATISFALGINLLLFGAIGPFAAAVMDRFGARRTITLALAVTAAQRGADPGDEPTLATRILLWGVAVGCCLPASSVAFLAAYIAGRWFRAREGFVVGLLDGGQCRRPTGLPADDGVPRHPFRLADHVPGPGRRSHRVSTASGPADAQSTRGCRSSPLRRSRVHRGRTSPPEGNPITVAFRALAMGVRSRDFWLIAGGYFVCGATTNGLIGTHLIAACVDHGLSEVAGAGLLGGTGVFALLGGTLAGWLSDRWDNRLLLCAYYGFRGLSLLYLPFAFDMSIYGLPVFSRRVRPRLDRQRAPDRAPPYWCCRSREDRDHGGVDYRHPSDW